jgi:periplasmic divalent cation tolerance protein
VPSKQHNILVVFVAASNQDEAIRISELAVKSHLAACATMIPTVQSMYWWEGNLVKDQESLVLLKTTTERFNRLQEAILAIHSYKVPEIIAIPIETGLPQYLEWVEKETTESSGEV